MTARKTAEKRIFYFLSVGLVAVEAWEGFEGEGEESCEKRDFRTEKNSQRIKLGSSSSLMLLFSLSERLSVSLSP